MSSRAIRRSRWTYPLAVLATGAAALQCGSSATSGAQMGPDDADAPEGPLSSTDDGSATESASSDDGSSRDQGGRDGFPTDTGRDAHQDDAGDAVARILGVVGVSVAEQTPVGSGIWYSGFSANFYRDPFRERTVAEDRDCRVFSQEIPDGGYYRKLNAGEITLVLQQVPIQLSWDDHFELYQGFGASGARAYEGGELCSVSAAGATVSPFDASTVAPDRLEILTPAVPPCPSTCPPFPLDRTKALVLTWTSARHGNVQIRLTADAPDAGPSTQRTTVECWFPVTGDGGTIPPSTLAHLPQGGPGTIQIQSTNDRASQFIPVDGGVVRFHLSNDTRWGDGRLGNRSLVITR